MMKEINSLHKNNTWKLIDGKKAISCKWVIVKKEGSLNGDNVCYKSDW